MEHLLLVSRIERYGCSAGRVEDDQNRLTGHAVRDHRLFRQFAEREELLLLGQHDSQSKAQGTVVMLLDAGPAGQVIGFVVVMPVALVLAVGPAQHPRLGMESAPCLPGRMRGREALQLRALVDAVDGLASCLDPQAVRLLVVKDKRGILIEPAALSATQNLVPYPASIHDARAAQR